MNNVNTTPYPTIKAFSLAITLLSLCACEQHVPLSTLQSPSASLRPIHRKAASSHKHVWGRIGESAKMSAKETHSEGHKHVQKYVKKFSQEEKSLTKMGSQATPYLYYIVEQLEKRNMPTELALLPMVESAFQPQATSHQGAAGLWQFIPSTGRNYGLKQDEWYDGRRDIKASTQAALNYLSFLHKEFDNNWILALAAYNAGEGTIHKAIKQNKLAGKPITFWDLKLPKETREYIPRFLALAEIIKNPEKHAISMPHIANKPYFMQVNPGTPLNFHQAAKLADINIHELKRLNPGYRRASTHPKGPQGILLPVANVERFEYNLAKKR